MTITELMQIAIDNYPDGLVGEYWVPPKNNRGIGSIKWNRRAGDTLALFIAAELKDTYDPEADSVDQLEEAVRVLFQASKELSDLAGVFHDRAMEIRMEREENDGDPM